MLSGAQFPAHQGHALDAAELFGCQPHLMAEQAFQLALAERYALQQIGQPRPAFAGRDPVEQLLHRVAACLDLLEPAEQTEFDYGLLRVLLQLGQPIDQMRQAQPGPVGLLKPVKLIEADAEYRSAHAGRKRTPSA